MKRFIAVLLLLLFVRVDAAQADWRWSPPKFKTQLLAYSCNPDKNPGCFQSFKHKIHQRNVAKLQRYNIKKLREWVHWTSIPIPSCIWYGESGTGAEYARYRYTLPNSGGSGAYGKFQFMPSTYFANAKYGDWSPLDQEIAARREYSGLSVVRE